MYDLLNKVNADTNGLSKEDLTMAQSYATDFVIQNLRVPTITKLTDEIKTEIDGLMEPEADAIRKWTKAQRNASQQANVMRSQPSGRRAAGEEFRKLFAESAADKDGRLNLAGWLNFVEKSEEAKEARGEPSTYQGKEHDTALFNMLNKVTEKEEGISMQDIVMAFNYGRTCIDKKLGSDFGKEQPLSEEIKNGMTAVLQ